MEGSQHLRVAVAGGGVAGMALSLALARLGHPVTLIDRDASTRPAQAAGAALWKRAGVPQFHQPHAFLARLCSELLADLPDVVDALHAAGAVDIALPDGLRSFWCRRSTLEWVLRRRVEAEAGVDIRAEAVREVETHRGAAVGVRLAGGGLHPADLVVDCGGRRSRLTAGLAAEESVNEPTNEIYQSRRYRLRPGQQFGPANRGVIAVEEADGYSVLVFPHDAGTFTVTFVHLPEDEALAALNAVGAFEAAASAVPLSAEWTSPDIAEPISDVMVMSGLRNIFRPLGPATPLGLHAVGDVVSTTNPHFGRGCALAVAHALVLSRAVAQDPTDPELWRKRVDAWVQDELWPWFDDGRSLDRARSAAWREVMAGGTPTPGGAPAGPGAGPAAMPRFLVLAAGAAGVDPAVSRAVMRHMHMADPPARLGAVESRVAELLAAGWLPSRPAGVPTRTELVDVLSEAGHRPRDLRGAAGDSPSEPVREPSV